MDICEKGNLPTNAILEAVRRAGSQTQLAALLKVTKGAVNHWVHGRNILPLHHCLEIERLTGVRCEALRTDVQWSTRRTKPRLSQHKNSRATPKGATTPRSGGTGTGGDR